MDQNESSMNITEKVVILIPTYNEAQVISNTIGQIFESSKNIDDYEIEVLIFDSSSTDNTQKIVKKLQHDNPKLHLLTEDRKSGLGSAYLKAMNFVIENMAANIIVEFDADLSHQPKYIGEMLEKIKNYDVVVGSRYISGGSIPNDWELHRRLFSLLGNLVARFFLTLKYKDFTSGFRFTRVTMLRKILPQKFLSSGYAYKLHLFWLLHKNKAKILEYPIDFIDRARGYSKLPKNAIYDSLRVVILLRGSELKQYFKMCLVETISVVIHFFTYHISRFFLEPVNSAQFAISIAILNNFIFGLEMR